MDAAEQTKLARAPVFEWVRTRLQLGTDPAELPSVIVRVLVAGSLVLATIGLVGLVNEWSVSSAVLPGVALILVGWGLWGLRADKPAPIPMLVTASALATTYLIVAAITQDREDALNTTPIVVVAAAGAIVALMGGRSTRLIYAAMLPLVGIATLASQVAIDGEPIPVLVDALATVTTMGMVHIIALFLSRGAAVGQESYQRLMDAAPIAVLEADFTGVTYEGGRLRGWPVVLRINDLARDMYGLRAGVVESVWDQVFDERLFKTTAALLADMVSRQALTGTGVVSSDAGREYLVQWRAVGPTLERVTFSAMDITAQRVAAEALAEQVRSRDQFIASVSHELRTPLTGGLGLLELIRDGSLEGGEAEEAFVLAIAQIRDLSDIVQDLLVAARADTGTLHIRPETVDLAQVSVDLVRSLEGHVQTDVHGPVPVLADPVRVRQIVRNLTTNAVRYGGRSQRLIVMPPGVVEVRDDGPPIPDDVRAVMFEAYARTPSSEAPTDSVGLGLTVARTLARLMGGDLTYHHDGTESVFTLSLPGAAG